MHWADTVLMDLRGFDSQRMGCEFELHELARRLDPRRVVLVVDDSTDRRLLEDRVTVGEQRMVVVDLRHSGSDAVFEALLRAGG